MAEDTHDKFLRYAVIITPYASVIALLYLWGYWGVFKIDILSFISLVDILKLALLPLIYVIFIAALNSTIFYFTTLLKGGEPPSPPLRSVIIAYLFLGIMAVGIAFMMTGPSRWLWAGTAIAVLIARMLEDLPAFKSHVPNRSMRFAIAVLILAPVGMAFGMGRQQAQWVLDGTRVKFVETKLIRESGSESFIKKHLLEGQEKLKFLGIAGDYVFFLSVDNSKSYVVKFSDLHFLQFDQIDD